MSFSDDTLQLCKICKDVIVKNPKKHYEKGVPCNICNEKTHKMCKGIMLIIIYIIN